MSVYTIALRASCAAAAICLLAPPLHAAVTTYPSRAAWAAAAGTPTGGENFNGFTQDVPARAVPAQIQGASVSSVDTATFPTNSSNQIDVFPFEFPNSYHLDDTPYFLANTELKRTITFQFTSPVTAWAADFRRDHVYPNNGWFDITFPRMDLYSDGGALLGSVPLTTTYAADALEFYGFTITGGAASRLVIANSTTPINSVFGIDNIDFVAVPEPTTCAMTAFGLVALTVRVRGRSSNSTQRVQHKE